MEKVNPKIYAVIGLALITMSIPLAAGMVALWPASAGTWKNTEVRAIYAPRAVEPGAEIRAVTVLAYNGWRDDGDVLINVYVPGYPAWQFTEYVESYAEANLTLWFYRSVPVMPEGPLTITAEDGYSGKTQAAVTIYPAAPAAEPTNGTDGSGGEPDGDGYDEPGAHELAVIEYLQTLAPRLTVETLTMGGFTALAGVGFIVLGGVQEEKRR